MLRLDQLAAWPQLSALVRLLKEELPGPALREEAWSRLLAETEAQGWLRPGLPLHDADPEATLLDSLACELDFVVNAVFVRHAALALSTGREWYAPEELEAIEDELTAIGWKPEAVENAIEAIPARVRLWTLTL